MTMHIEMKAGCMSNRYNSGAVNGGYGSSIWTFVLFGSCTTSWLIRALLVLFPPLKLSEKCYLLIIPYSAAFACSFAGCRGILSPWKPTMSFNGYSNSTGCSLAGERDAGKTLVLLKQSFQPCKAGTLWYGIDLHRAGNISLGGF